MDIAIIIGLLLLGSIFILLELFFLPGISVAIFGGIGCYAAAVILAFQRLGELAGSLTLIATLVAAAVSVYLFFRSKTLDKMSLNSEIDSTVDSMSGSGIQIGDQGLCLSRLAPMGKVLIQGKTLEGKAENEMIEEGCIVEVIAVESNHVTVKRATSEISQ